MAPQKQYTRSEVANNNDADKVLLILHDKVYNVHSFLNEHPGGEEVLNDHKGVDGSEDFNDVGHSNDALDLMKKYQVGEVVESERLNQPMKKGWVAGYNKKTPEKYVQGPGVPFYLLAGGIVFILALYYYLF
ncbi:cytochrome b5-like [Odontomachus brunneus]|uniref:cytochrome b5-like n=1 Tax=Odontomachus brunneus TaxID=486640 RepID=UPI0013F1C2AC|nr:cytochrome b5-like [Odontomachus brunneus]XP_032675941.1 cytochrome b5-like [Odontomachus brunneus]